MLGGNSKVYVVMYTGVKEEWPLVVTSSKESAKDWVESTNSQDYRVNCWVKEVEYYDPY